MSPLALNAYSASLYHSLKLSPASSTTCGLKVTPPCSNTSAASTACLPTSLEVPQSDFAMPPWTKSPPRSPTP